MIRHLLRRTIVGLLAASLLATVTATTPAAAASGASLTFVGGGYGHGIGMSQYGAYGRAAAGHGYQQILAHYYDGATMGSLDAFGNFGPGTDDVDVLLSVRSEVAISTPVVNGGPQPGWTVAISANGTSLGTATTPVSARRVGSGWSIKVGGVERCTAACNGAAIAVVLTSGSHVVLEAFEDGPNLGNGNGGYAHGRIELHPAAGNGCGSGDQFCVVHGGLDMQDYVRGIGEIPSSWPLEAQKAQAVAARSFAASAIIRRAGNGRPFDLYASTQDQNYVGHSKETACGNWCTGVASTDNQVLVHSGTVIEAYYSSSNGGYSAPPPDVWSGARRCPTSRPSPTPSTTTPRTPTGCGSAPTRWPTSAVG
ncbi:MAG: SpoIID/LytB domain-containing protein [Acidimicrobiales bacterium]